MMLHSNRVAGLVSAMCCCLGMSRRTRDQVVLSAYVHDIGKWALPSSILRKSGEPDADEWQKIREHTTVGAKMLESAGLHQAAEVALRHHEAWDGSGYPDGLKAEAIPFAARVAAICDVYSALRENRPYRAGLLHDQALGVIAKGDALGRTRPDMFDPRLLSLFVERHQRMAEVFEATTQTTQFIRTMPMGVSSLPFILSPESVSPNV